MGEHGAACRCGGVGFGGEGGTGGVGGWLLSWRVRAITREPGSRQCVAVCVHVRGGSKGVREGGLECMVWCGVCMVWCLCRHAQVQACVCVCVGVVVAREWWWLVVVSMRQAEAGLAGLGWLARRQAAGVQDGASDAAASLLVSSRQRLPAPSSCRLWPRQDRAPLPPPSS